MAITMKEIAEYLSKYDVVEYDGVQETGKTRYNLYIKDGALMPPHKANGAERFTAYLDVTEYAEDDTPERITESETIDDDSFRELCEDFMSQIRGRV